MQNFNLWEHEATENPFTSQLSLWATVRVPLNLYPTRRRQTPYIFKAHVVRPWGRRKGENGHKYQTLTQNLD